MICGSSDRNAHHAGRPRGSPKQRPAIEFENVHRGFDGLREDDFDAERFEAWTTGRTGLPLIDACMRWGTQTGWLNFRMRALLMSFAGYHLWLHWREPALHLARMFTDYEPGIHFNQCQMQNGTTGINTLRIYNPVKQTQDQDPNGAFVRRWVPELARVPTPAIFEPWKLDAADRKRWGAADYPDPIVDPVGSARAAREKITEFRRRDGFREETDRIQQQQKRKSAGDRRQRSLFWGGWRTADDLRVRIGDRDTRRAILQFDALHAESAG